MSEVGSSRAGGCRLRLILVAALLWFGAVPLGTPLLLEGLTEGLTGSEFVDLVTVIVMGLVLVAPLAGLALMMGRRRPGGGAAATLASLAVVAGHVALDAVLRLVLPPREFLVPLASRYLLAALRLAILIPYAALAAWVGTRLTGLSRGLTRNWLGLGSRGWSAVLLAFFASALTTVPWPLTGALGDSLASLAITLQWFALTVPQVLIFWGIVFVLLTATFPRTEGAAVVTILIFGLSALGRALPGRGWGAVTDLLFLLPLGFLLTELRARGGRPLSLLPLALFYQLAPQLFVDPRDVLGRGLPEVQHVVAYAVAALTATVLGTLLWLGRRASDRRAETARRESETGSNLRPVLALATVAVWVVWIGLYDFAGEPRFFNHGFLIILSEQADLATIQEMDDPGTRLRAVYRALVETAEATQGPIVEELEGRGIGYRRYYIINMVRVDGHRWLMGRFEGRSEVANVILNPNVRRYPRRLPIPYGSAPHSPGVLDNLAAIGADEAWELGVRGGGVVVGGQDTGYDWEHPALRPRYRGWDGENADHDYNWHDAWSDTHEPFDDGSHGTHTMGTVLGDDGGDNRVGVAPEATWFGCRNMRRGIGNPGSYAECMEFLFAPYPLGGDAFEDGDVSRGAQIVNNSWGCPRMEGCFAETLRPALEALRSAGVMMVVSAGNDGPACRTATTPPANYEASFTVGATTDTGRVIGFSSRGPAGPLTKPDITAPGVSVRSSVPGGGYGSASGTSMAAPHVAGAVALLWSADESLIGEVEATAELLCRTAVAKPVSRSCEGVSAPEGPLAAASTPAPCACGGLEGVPNNVYGCGMLDVEEALSELLDR